MDETCVEALAAIQAPGIRCRGPRGRYVRAGIAVAWRPLTVIRDSHAGERET